MNEYEKWELAIELINEVIVNYYLNGKVDQVDISFLEIAVDIFEVYNAKSLHNESVTVQTCESFIYDIKTIGFYK